MIRAKVPRSLCLLLAFSLAAGARADVGLLPVSSDYDAEFARAADLLEAGRLGEAEIVLAEISRKSGQPAWQARAVLALAAADLSRKDFASAIGRLKTADVSAIGLEPYRKILLARAYEGAGRTREEIGQYRAAFHAEVPFALRAEAGRSLAEILEKQKDLREAAVVLARAASLSGPAPGVSLALARLRVALVQKDTATVRAAARELLFARAPARELSAPIERALRDEEARLSPADRGRLARAAVASGDMRRAVRLFGEFPARLWPKEDRGQNFLALARAQAGLGRSAQAVRNAARVPRDGSAADFEARLFRENSAWERLASASPAAKDADRESSALAYLALTAPSAPAPVRRAARERLVRLSCDRGDFEGALVHARAITRESPEEIAGFEPLWKFAWELYQRSDFAGARRSIEALADVYTNPSRQRRLLYWRARCLEREKAMGEARPLFVSLAAAYPPDLYALFARRRAPGPPPRKPSLLPDPSTATAVFRRTDELLRLRLFAEAAAEARALSGSRGRDLRLAEAEFALGRFPSAVAAARRAFPEMGTAAEARVPDGWRRLFYPIEEKGYLAERASQFGLDVALLRAIVRQESVFDPRARSRAGALGLTQLMPATAKSLFRSVLRARYRRAFLYDPGVNARLGAAYFRRLLDRFGRNTVFALAAYNGGPTRMARVARENAGRDEDEIFESHPASETRDYVNRVMLYAESYRELYP